MGWCSELGFSETLAAVDRSLQRLRTSYLDGYLIHWPQCYPEVSPMGHKEQTRLNYVHQSLTSAHHT